MASMEIKVYSCWSEEIEVAYRAFSSDKDVSPYCDAVIIREIRRHAIHLAPIRFRLPIILAATDGNSILGLLPLTRDLFSGKVKMLADMRGVSITAPLFSPTLSPSKRREALDSMSKWISERKASLYRIEDAAVADSLTQSGLVEKRKTDCCIIDIATDYDTWFRGLSKSVRQNIRTAYNRLNRDNLKYELSIGSGKESAEDAFRLYLRRQLSQYVSGGIAKRLFKSYCMRTGPITASLRKGGTHALLKINGETAACISYFDKSGDWGLSLAVPRMAVNTKYKFYSPGYILLCELISRYLRAGLPLKIDLGRGTEKYKTDLGAMIYHTTDFTNK